MTFWDTLALAVALGCDAFAVGLAVGAVWRGKRQLFRLSFHFGVFQALMPLIGWFGGAVLVNLARTWAPWLAAAILAFIAFHMAKESLWGEEETRENGKDPTRGWSLVMLSVATSIDALGAGLSLGLVGADIWFPVVVIGVIAAAMTATGMGLGGLLGQRWGRAMGLVGALVLLGIAVNLVLG
ncbi:MAG: manganese efflux pump MntP family protein [Deltaproteobacteria bacterium]|nr:manganese efflux pump MntP family protein [Deltaproteobacteria bacterium]